MVKLKVWGEAENLFRRCGHQQERKENPGERRREWQLTLGFCFMTLPTSLVYLSQKKFPFLGAF